MLPVGLYYTKPSVRRGSKVMTEERAAQTLNIVMATLLGLPIAAFMTWNAATAYVAVRQIYEGLTLQQRSDLGRFVNSVAILLFVFNWAVGAARKRFRRVT